MSVMNVLEDLFIVSVLMLILYYCIVVMCEVLLVLGILISLLLSYVVLLSPFEVLLKLFCKPPWLCLERPGDQERDRIRPGPTHLRKSTPTLIARSFIYTSRLHVSRRSSPYLPT